MKTHIESVKTQLHLHRKTVEGVFLTLALRALQLLLGLMTTFFVVRNFSVEHYGHYSFILTVVGVLSIFSLPGMGQVVSQSAARGFRGTYRASLRYVVAGCCFASLVLAGFAGYSYFENMKDLVWPYLIAAAFFPVISGLSLWKSLHLGEEKFRRLFAIGSLNSILNSVLVILAAHFFPGNLAVLLFAFWIVPALQNINQTVRSLNVVSKDEQEEAGSIPYGVKSSLYSVLGVISSNVDSILIFTFLSPVHLALFAAAQKIPELIKANIQEIGKALLPKFSKQKSYTHKTDQFFKWFSIIVGGGILLVTATIYPFVFRSIFGEKYEDAIFYSQILMCSIALANVAPLKFWFVSSRLDIKTSRDVNILIGITRIVISGVLIPIWGVQGAVASALIHRIITSTGIHFLMRKRYPILSSASEVENE